MKRIWFNHWFSTAYHFIQLLKNNVDGMEFEVWGTNRDPNAVYLQVCDHVDVEPSLQGLEYIRFCLDFCRTNNIDVFIPRHQLLIISENLSLFHEIGTKVLINPDFAILQTISNKAQLYHVLERKNIVEIPDYQVVRTEATFKRAYQELSGKGHRVCFKPVSGEGGAGFRILDQQADTIETLFTSMNQKLSFDHACQILSSVDTFPELMVMEYLDGPEYSIDCLAQRGHLLAAIPRKKVSSRVRSIEARTDLHKIAEELTSFFNLSYIFNIQVIYKNGQPKLLEINPRMSGGLYISCLTGVNLPYLAVKLLLDGEIAPLKPTFGIQASHIETGVIIKS